MLVLNFILKGKKYNWNIESEECHDRKGKKKTRKKTL